jgi:Tfp pilus assembly protein PilF
MMTSVAEQNPNPKVIEANSYINNGDLPKARKVLEDAINNGEEYAYLYLALGDICSAQNENVDAKKYYEKSINIASNDDQLRVAAKAGLARIYLQEASDEFDALTEFQQIDELHNLVSVVIKKKKLQKILIASNSSACTTPSGHRGKWVANPAGDDPPYICKRI